DQYIGALKGLQRWCKDLVNISFYRSLRDKYSLFEILVPIRDLVIFILLVTRRKQRADEMYIFSKVSATIFEAGRSTLQEQVCFFPSYVDDISIAFRHSILRKNLIC